MKLRVMFTAIIGMILAGEAQSSQFRSQDLILDLTGAELARPTGAIGTEGGAISTSPQPLPLEIRLVSLNCQELRLGQRLVLEVEVTNTGRGTFQFPRSVDLARFVPGNRSVTARIHLQAKRQKGVDADFAVIGLAGSEDLPETLQALEPGQKLLIRIPGSVALDGEAIDDLSAKGAAPVNAVLAVTTPDVGITWAQAVSWNSLPVVFRK